MVVRRQGFDPRLQTFADTHISAGVVDGVLLYVPSSSGFVITGDVDQFTSRFGDASLAVRPRCESPAPR